MTDKPEIKLPSRILRGGLPSHGEIREEIEVYDLDGGTRVDRFYKMTARDIAPEFYKRMLAKLPVPRGALFGTLGNPWPTAFEILSRARLLIGEGFTEKDGAPSQLATELMAREQLEQLPDWHRELIEEGQEIASCGQSLSLQDKNHETKLVGYAGSSKNIGQAKGKWFTFRTGNFRTMWFPLLLAICETLMYWKSKFLTRG